DSSPVPFLSCFKLYIRFTFQFSFSKHCFHCVRFFSIFSLLHLILKGGLVGCCNQGSWSGSDQSQDIYCQTRNITKYFSESKYSKWNRALRVAACRGLQEMDVLSSSLRADSEPRRSDLIPESGRA